MEVQWCLPDNGLCTCLLINSSRLCGESLFQQPSVDKIGKPSCSITKDADTEAYKVARYTGVS